MNQTAEKPLPLMAEESFGQRQKASKLKSVRMDWHLPSKADPSIFKQKATRPRNQSFEGELLLKQTHVQATIYSMGHSSYPTAWARTWNL